MSAKAIAVIVTESGGITMEGHITLNKVGMDWTLQNPVQTQGL
jgi:hypothetical protein